jgi:hypothetical protein
VVGVPVLSRSILLDVAAMRTGVAMRVMIAWGLDWVRRYSGRGCIEGRTRAASAVTSGREEPTSHTHQNNIPDQNSLQTRNTICQALRREPQYDRTREPDADHGGFPLEPVVFCLLREGLGFLFGVAHFCSVVGMECMRIDYFCEFNGKRDGWRGIKLALGIRLAFPLLMFVMDWYAKESWATIIIRLGLGKAGMKCGSYRYWIRLDTFLKIGKNHARSGSVAVQFWTHVVSR